MSDERAFILKWRSAVLNSSLSSTIKLCLLVLAEWANADGTSCYPSIPSIAIKASVNEKTVRRSLDQAELAGFIKRSRKGTAQGWRRFIYLPTIPECSDVTPARSSDGAGTEPTPLPAKCGHSVHDVRALSPTGADTGPTDLAITYPVPSEKQSTQRPSRFEDWWGVYPKKVGRKPALVRWQSRKLDAIADRLIADVLNRIANDDGWLRGFVPNPCTYLNQDRWEDDLRIAPIARAALPSQQTESKQMLGLRALEEIKRGLVNCGNSHRVTEVGGALPVLESGA